MVSVRSVLFPFSAVLLWLLVILEVDAQSRVEEVKILASFRDEMERANDLYTLSDGVYWFSWNENDENTCAWVGVTCSSNYTVAALDFSGWEIIVLTSLVLLSKLPDLRQLDMSSSGFYRTLLPEDIGNLTKLTRLDFSGNTFTGTIPPTISNCRSLQYLSLERNAFFGAIPDLSEMVQLKFLHLADNQLEGPFPRELGESNSLLVIDISRNNLSGLIPSLVNATNLRQLLLENNSFIGFEEPMYINAPNLQELVVTANQLEGIIPVAITNLSNLITLNMSSNRLSGKIPSGLWSNAFMNVLDLSKNQLSDIPVDLLYPPLNSTPSVITINISYNSLTGSIPTPPVANFQFENVVFLDLSYNQLVGHIPSQLGVVLNLYYLDLGNNLLSGDIVDALLDIQSFGGTATLYLGNNHLTGDLTKLTFQWAKWNYLKRVDLSSNNFSWTASESIPDPVSAALNNLGSNNADKSGSCISEFRVGGNNFSGTSLPLAPLYNVFHNLEVLDFSNCQLEGVISGDVFNGLWMPGLKILNLSNNLAAGTVPKNITTLPSLTSLDLSNNKLSGPLPSIPLNSILFTPSIFLGNDGLCGYPLPQCSQLTGVQWWILLIIIGASMITAIGSLLIVAWRWRVYHKRHEQDADLIRTLMERELVTLMPLRHLKKATDNFAQSARIGEGGFGTVYVGKLNDGTRVAIKRSKQEGSEKDKEQFLNEVRILSQVNHRHLVKLMGCCMENKVALLVFEFVSNGTLQEHLQGKFGDGLLSWKQRLDIAVQTADALTYLHSASMIPIYHRDVKSANILLNDDFSAKVADFGISKLAPMNATHVSTAIQGTMGYIDPEYWVSFQLTEKSDVYSFGVVLLELISAKLVVDFQRGGDKTSLVIFASPYVVSGDLQPLIDPNLMGTYSEKNGYGKESILDVGRLAIKCVNMQSKFRPSMNKVWKELQDLYLKWNSTLLSKDLGFMDSNNIENPRVDHEVLDREVLLSQPAFSDSLGVSSSCFMQDNARSLQLAQLSPPPKVTTRLVGN